MKAINQLKMAKQLAAYAFVLLDERQVIPARDTESERALDAQAKTEALNALAQGIEAIARIERFVRLRGLPSGPPRVGLSLPLARCAPTVSALTPRVRDHVDKLFEELADEWAISEDIDPEWAVAYEQALTEIARLIMLWRGINLPADIDPTYEAFVADVRPAFTKGDPTDAQD